jgi:hypothetical protein
MNVHHLKYPSFEPMRILHILDHSLPLHSGYTFHTAAILREQQRLGWRPFTSPGPSRNR